MLFQTLGIPDSGSLFPQNNGGKINRREEEEKRRENGRCYIPPRSYIAKPFYPFSSSYRFKYLQLYLLILCLLVSSAHQTLNFLKAALPSAASLLSNLLKSSYTTKWLRMKIGVEQKKRRRRKRVDSFSKLKFLFLLCQVSLQPFLLYNHSPSS